MQHSPTIAQSYLQMPYNQFVWLRKEFMCLCGDMLEAMIMRVIEYEIEGDRRTWLRKATQLIEKGKPIPEEPEWWITLSHKQIRTRLYDAIKNEKTLRAKLKSLIEDKKFLLVRDDPDNRYGSPQYTLNKELVQQKLNTLPALPTIKDAALSQATPLPEMVPPPNIDTSSQNREEGGTRNGTSPLLKMGPAASQNREVPPTKNGGTNKKRENTKELPETKERETQAPTNQQAPASSLSPSSSNSSQKKNGHALVSHPEHGFLWFDDLIAPSVMIVMLTPAFPHRHWSELEDKRRKRIALWEIRPLLEEQGISVVVEWKHEEGTPQVVQSLNKGDGITQERALATGGLLASLTEEEAAFWKQWCSVSGVAYESLTQTAHNHVKFLAGKGLSTEELQSLHDAEFARICAQAEGKEPVAPHLGNLVNAYPNWAKVREWKSRSRVEQKPHHLPGTGQINDQSWKKNAPPVDYSYAMEQASKPTRRTRSTGEAGSIDAAEGLAKLRDGRKYGEKH